MSRFCSGIDIFDAIRDQCRKDVLNFFNCGGDNEVLDAYQQTPLHVAAAAGNESIFSLLMSRGANITARDKNQETPLHKAAASGFLKAVEALVKEGAEVDAQDKRRMLTPLHRACQGGHLPVVKFLLAAGANQHRGDKELSSPLHWAAYSGSVEVVRFLLERGSNIDVRCQRRQTPLFCGCINGHVEVVRYLLAMGCDPMAKSSAGALPEDRVDYLKVDHATTEILKALLRNARAGNRPRLQDVHFPPEPYDPTAEYEPPMQRTPSMPDMIEHPGHLVRRSQSFQFSARELSFDDTDMRLRASTTLLQNDDLAFNAADDSTEEELLQLNQNRVEELEKELEESQQRILQLEQDLNNTLVQLVKPVRPRIIPEQEEEVKSAVGVEKELAECKAYLKKISEDMKQHKAINNRLQLAVARQEENEKEEKSRIMNGLHTLSFIVPAVIFGVSVFLRSK